MFNFASQTFDIEMEMRKNMLEDTVEMGAAVANEATSEATKYAVDDKITKLKEHWESVCLKFTGQKRMLQDMNEEWSSFEELRMQLEGWIRNAEVYFSDASAKEPGSTVTELEEHLHKHKVVLLPPSSLFFAILSLCQKWCVPGVGFVEKLSIS